MAEDARRRTPSPVPPSPNPQGGGTSSAPPPSAKIDFMALLSSKNRAKLKRKLQADFLAQVPGMSQLDQPYDAEQHEEVRGPSGWVYRDTSIFCLTPWDEPRKSAILLVESKPFDPLILFTILCNCVTMAWQSPLDPPGTWKEGLIGVCEVVFLAIFTCEMLVKILAYGFLMHKGSYLRDSWCQLDFVVVTLAWLPIIFPSFGNYSVLRAFRALRPLRALKRLPGMPVLVQWILDVLPKMGSVLALFGFIFLVFGIVGMELFKGSLHYRCALPGFHAGLEPHQEAPYDSGINCALDRPYTIQCSVHNHLGDGVTCAYFKTNPQHGMVSFDSIALVFIALVQATTFDDWAESMYGLMSSFSPYASMYHVLIVAIGGFFVVNLFLAVIFLEYASSKKSVDDDIAAGISDDAPPGPLPGPRPSSSPKPQRRSSVTAEELDAAALLAGVVHLSDGTQKGAGGVIAPKAVKAETSCLAAIANSSALATASLILVIINMVLMCMSYETMSDSYGTTLEQCATAITWAFIIEMAIKLMGLGCHGYWSDGWNQLDGAIVTLSIVDMVLTFIFASSGVKLSFLRILRILRVLRVLRLMRSWRGLYKIVATFLRAMPQLANIIILILLFMFMFSLLGMQLFGGIYTESAGYSPTPCPAEVCEGALLEKPHFHFDYCAPAMITVFVLLTGEWVEAMEPVAALEGAKSSIFFIFVVMLGKFFLLNLLIAVILHEFAEEDTDLPNLPETAREGGNGSQRDIFAETERSPSPFADTPSPVGKSLWKNALSKQRETTTKGRWSNLLEQPRHKWPSDYSLLCFAPDHFLRRASHRIIKHWAFDQIVLLAIVVSSVALALDTPRLAPDSDLKSTLHYLDYFFVGFFFVEMSLKVIAHGFAFGEGAYLKSAWNQIDFVIVLISILVLAAETFPALNSLRVMRVMRVLRPLRLVSRNAGMKLIITSLFKALPAVSNVLGVIFCLQVVFAIIGMQLFSGTMAACTEPTILTREACESTPNDYWANPTIGSFDDFGSAMRLLYVMSSADQWELPMFTMMSSTAAGEAPRRNDFSPYALFPILWMFFSYVFAINLFVGVVVDNFSRMEKRENGSAMLTIEQQQWVSTMKTAVKLLPAKVTRPPHHPIIRALYIFVNSSFFDGVITSVVVLNIGVMACDYYGIEDDPSNLYLYNQAMLAFTSVYYCECVLKLVALGLDGYFGDGWNRFDFFLVCTSLVDEFATELLASILPIPPMLLRVLRIFRILRILRLLRHAKSLRDLIVTMVLSFPSLFNVASLLALVIYIYAVLGVQLFTYVKPGISSGAIHGGMTVDRNFHTFGSSFLLLFQCLTGDGWSSIMADAMEDGDTGTCSTTQGNCGSIAAVPYFISFQVIGCFVFVNLIVAVILENFSTLHYQDPDLVSSSDIEVFVEAWAGFDPDASNLLPLAQLPSLLLTVPRPLGLKGRSDKRAKQLCMRLRLFSQEGQVHFRDVLLELIENNYFRSGMDFDEEEFKGLVPTLDMNRISRPSSPGTQLAGGMSLDTPSSTGKEQAIDEFFATATILQEHIFSKLRQMLIRARKRLAARAKADKKANDAARLAEKAMGSSGNGNRRPSAATSMMTSSQAELAHASRAVRSRAEQLPSGHYTSQTDPRYYEYRGAAVAPLPPSSRLPPPTSPSYQRWIGGLGRSITNDDVEDAIHGPSA